MKIFKLFLLTTLMLSFGFLQGQSCKIKLDNVTKAYNSDDMKKAFDVFSDAFKTCDKAAFKSLSPKNYEAYYKNLYNYGKDISFILLEDAQNKQDSLKYGKAIVDIYDRWAKDEEQIPENYTAEKLYYAKIFGFISRKEFYDEFRTLLDSKNNPDIASETLDYALWEAIELVKAKEISMYDMMKFYGLIDNAFEYNVQTKGLEFQEYLEKEDSIKMNKNEKEYMAFLGNEIERYEEFADYADSILTPFMTCDVVTQRYYADFDNYKDSIKQLGIVYATMYQKIQEDSIENNCTEASYAFLDKLESRYNELYQLAIKRAKENGSAGVGGDISPLDMALYQASKAHRAGNWDDAIKYYKEAYELSSGSKKGMPAYQIAALYYHKKGSRGATTLDWALKAAQAGFAGGYQMAATIYGNKNNINSCGTKDTQKLAAYLVAADYMRKAGRMSSRINGESIARQYEAAGPSREQMFNDGYSPGQRISVTCLRGASTTLR